MERGMKSIGYRMSGDDQPLVTLRVSAFQHAIDSTTIPSSPLST